MLYEELVAEAVRLEEQQALQQQARQGQAAAADVASRNPYGVAPSTGKPAVAREAAVEPHVLQAQRVDQARKRLFVILMVVLGCVFFGTLAFVLAVI